MQWAYRVHGNAAMPNVLAQVLTGEIDRAVAGLEPMWDAVPAHIEEVPTARVMPFASRVDAGRALGRALAYYAGPNSVVLGVPHGGVVVAAGVAQQLRLPLDCWLVRALRPVTEPTLVLGIVSEGPNLMLEREALERTAMERNQLRALLKDTADQMAVDARAYRRGRPPLHLEGKTVIIVDEGIRNPAVLATAADGVRRRGASKLIVAAPVGVETAVATLANSVECLCLMLPVRVRRLGAWYQSYRPVSDGALIKILASIAPT
jgi:putative phosphoribosyl transferase